MARPRTIYPGLNDNEGGRPLGMDRQVPGPTGDLIPVCDAIIDLVSRGWPLREACHLHAENTGTVHRWLADGARVATKQQANPDYQPTETETKYANFRKAYAAARANIIGDYLGVVDELGRGGRRIVETRIEREHDGPDDPGRVVKSVTTTKALPPKLEALQYRLAVLDGARFSPRVALSVDAVEGELSEDEQADALVEAFGEFLEAEGIEVEPQRAIEAPEP